MIYESPPLIPHLTAEDIEEIRRLMQLRFGDDSASWLRFLHSPNEAFPRDSPIEMITRDELGVVRVISYLRDAVGNAPR